MQGNMEKKRNLSDGRQNEDRNGAGNRKSYLDVLKFIGIFFIYLGHMADAAGSFYPFVFMYHVPLFFFVSGCAETLGRKRSFPEYVIHKVKTILIPWLFFALVSIVAYTVYADMAFGLAEVRLSLVQILQGCVRNRFLAGSLWFFTCQFVICIVFRLMENWKHFFILLVCVLAYLAAAFLLPQNLPGEPSWYWNVDSAMYYMLYYCAGYLMFPGIDRILSGDRKRADRVLSGSSENADGKPARAESPARGKVAVRIAAAAVWAACCVYTVLCYFGSDFLSFLWALPVAGTLIYYLQALVIILFFLGVAWILRDVEAFRKIGRDTLYLCGNEMIIKELIPAFAAIFGLEVSLDSTLETVVYIALLLLVTEKLLIPAEKQLLARFTQS
ncbi:MAG: acyltransferase family protein [Lachnospiraceae bacterium]|nr:acyltransferase family protein [Lachnospiraceae bacterium]